MKKPRLTPKIGQCIAYYRVSTDRQGESGLGLEAQRAAVAQYTRHVPLLAEYTEVESGKRHDNRPQLLAALDDCKKRGATLVIAKLDRLARNVHFISGLMESGVEFIAADMPQANRLTVHIMAAFAEHEREMISQRTKAGLDAARREIAEKGFRISSKSKRKFTAFGNPRWQESIHLARVARDPQPVPPEVIEVIRRHRAEGDTWRTIADKLNSFGVRTPRGYRWHPSTVRNTLLPKRSMPDPAMEKPREIIRREREEGKSLRQIAAQLNLLGVKTASGARWHASSVLRALDQTAA